MILYILYDIVLYILYDMIFYILLKLPYSFVVINGRFIFYKVR